MSDWGQSLYVGTLSMSHSNSENPYLPPHIKEASEDLMERTYRVNYPPNECPKCQAPLTMWAGVQQTSIFRYRCPRCKAVYRLRVPGAMAITIAFLVAGTAICAGSVYGIIYAGGISPLLTLSLVLITGFVVELWMHRYVKKHGRFEEL